MISTRVPASARRRIADGAERRRTTRLAAAWRAMRPRQLQRLAAGVARLDQRHASAVPRGRARAARGPRGWRRRSRRSGATKASGSRAPEPLRPRAASGRRGRPRGPRAAPDRRGRDPRSPPPGWPARPRSGRCCARLRVRLISIDPYSPRRCRLSEPRSGGARSRTRCRPERRRGTRRSRPVAQPPEQEVEHVDAEVGEHAAARRLLAQEEVAWRTASAGSRPGAARSRADRPQQAVARAGCGRSSDRVEEAELEPDGEHGPAGLGRRRSSRRTRATLSAIGFSTSTWTPRRSSSIDTGAWRWFGRATMAASTPVPSSATSATARSTPNRLAIACARARSLSTSATGRAAREAASTGRCWSCAMAPQPMTATRSGSVVRGAERGGLAMRLWSRAATGGEARILTRRARPRAGRLACPRRGRSRRGAAGPTRQGPQRAPRPPPRRSGARGQRAARRPPARAGAR